MSFADWKKRSKVMHDVGWMYKDHFLVVAQAAYKAGERDGRKQVEAVAGNAIGLAVLAEREVCAARAAESIDADLETAEGESLREHVRNAVMRSNV